MSCYGTCWLLSGAWFQGRCGGFWMSSCLLIFPGIRSSLVFSSLDFSLLPLAFSLPLTVASGLLHPYSTDDKTSRLIVKKLSTVRDTQRDSQSYMDKRRGRREIQVTRRKRGGVKRGESSQASNHILKWKWILKIRFLKVQFSSVTQGVQLFVTPWTTAHQASLSITNSRCLPKPMSIVLVMPSNHLILCRPLLLLPSIFPSIRVFPSESALCIRWPKYWSFNFNISLSNEHPGLISFSMDWLDLLAVQGTLKSLLQHHHSKASILWRSAFFIVQLSHPYMTTLKTIALTRQTFVGKVMSLLFNMLSKLVITFLRRSKRLLISWLQSPSTVILEPRKIKSATVSTVYASVCHEVMGLDAMILVFWMLHFKPTFSLFSLKVQNW